MQTQIFKRILEKKVESGKTWDQIAKEAKIPVSSWMTGVPSAGPTDYEIRCLAPVLKTTYEWIRYGREKK